MKDDIFQKNSRFLFIYLFYLFIFYFIHRLSTDLCLRVRAHWISFFSLRRFKAL
jgi:hypothetical protein